MKHIMVMGGRAGEKFLCPQGLLAELSWCLIYTYTLEFLRLFSAFGRLPFAQTRMLVPVQFTSLFVSEVP